LGQNADHLRVQADYQFIRGLKFKLYFERVRKGGLLNVDDFGYNDDVDEPFLYGLLREDIYLGLETQYEIIHEFFIKGIYKYSVITDEDNLRTPDWMLGKNHNLSIELYYGLR
ncbi:MAG: hypothetical protein KJ799_06765, partial [Bacteroidetes bacterium]|nr:hypothetical protein [Bacteroidota bacterium]